MGIAARVFVVTVCIVSAISLANCAATSSSSPNTSIATADPEPTRPSATTSFEYHVGPRDTLQIAVFQVPDLNRTVQVDSGGFISLPLIGKVKVGGMTVQSAQDEISAKLGKSYLRSPQVSVSLVKSGQRVTLNGAVKNPTVLTIDGSLTLSQAIAQTGGVGELGNTERIHVARVTGQQVKDEVFNLDQIQSGKASDPPLYGGDIVIVEESNTKLALKNVKDLLPFAVIGSILSDVGVKRDLAPLVRLANGLTLYRYHYQWSDTVYVGVLAQDVDLVVPKAVSRGTDGYLRVNYSQLGLELRTCTEWMASRNGAERNVSCL